MKHEVRVGLVVAAEVASSSFARRKESKDEKASTMTARKSFSQQCRGHPLIKQNETLVFVFLKKIKSMVLPPPPPTTPKVQRPSRKHSLSTKNAKQRISDNDKGLFTLATPKKSKKVEPKVTIKEDAVDDDEAIAMTGSFDFDEESDLRHLADGALLVREESLRMIKEVESAEPASFSGDARLSNVIGKIRLQLPSAIERDSILPEDTVRDKLSRKKAGEGGDESEASSSESSEESDVDKEREKRENFFGEEIAVRDESTAGSFTEFGLSAPLLKAIDACGYSRPTPIQAASIPPALMGRDVCAGAETGSGKTAAFLIPVIERLIRAAGRKHSPRTRILVLLPTRELALQCAEVARKLTLFVRDSVGVCLLAGGMPIKTQASELRLAPDIVIGTPGRVLDHLRNTPGFHLQDTLEVLVLDEADRMLEDGFAAELDDIVSLLPPPEHRQSMLFSATMTEDVDRLARLSLRRPVRCLNNKSKTGADSGHDSDTETRSGARIAKRLSQQFVRVRPGHDSDEHRMALLLCLAERIVEPMPHPSKVFHFHHFHDRFLPL